MERKEHFCEVNGCSEKASYHLTWAQFRQCLREQHLCEQDASALMDQYWLEHRIGKGNLVTLHGATCFDIELVLISENHDEQVVYLREVGGPAYLPVLTGIFEAWSIALKLQGFQSPRPLTHDAMLGAIAALGGDMHDVLIDRIEGNTYYAKARVNQARKLVVIDMRPSDAFNLAITSDSPIFFTDDLVNKMATRDPAWPTK